MVSGHLAVTQRDGSADQGHRARERHAVGDPAPVPAGTVVVHPAVIECQGDGARTGRALSVENASAGGEQAAAGRGVAVHLGVVQAHGAVVDDSGAARVARGVVVDLGVVEHGIAAVGDAAGGNGRTLPRGGGGRVAVDLAVVPPQLAGAGREATVAVPAGDAAAVQRSVAVDLAVVDGDRAQQVLDAATAGVRGGVVVHLAVVEGQDAAATSEVHVVAARDPASDEPLRTRITMSAGAS